jgi:RNA polymerase-binding transcription factor DksA
MTADVLLGRSSATPEDSVVSVAAASLSPRAVLTAQWSNQLDRLTELSIRLHNGSDDAPADCDQIALVVAIDAARHEMETIEAALDRLTHHTYGRCETCGGPIDALRLVGLPAARTCRRCPAVAV